MQQRGVGERGHRFHNLHQSLVPHQRDRHFRRRGRGFFQQLVGKEKLPACDRTGRESLPRQAALFGSRDHPGVLEEFIGDLRGDLLVEWCAPLFELDEREQIRVVRKADIDAGAEARYRRTPATTQRLDRRAAEAVVAASWAYAGKRAGSVALHAG